jgi:hypothetical protein
MDRPATQRVARRGERAAQGLSFSGRHLGDEPGQHGQRAEQLHVVRPLAECAPRGLPPARADLRVVTTRTPRRGRQLRIGQRAQTLLARLDPRQQPHEGRQIDRSRLLQQAPHPVDDACRQHMRTTSRPGTRVPVPGETAP